jgi:hypothetical protein
MPIIHVSYAPKHSSATTASKIRRFYNTQDTAKSSKHEIPRQITWQLTRQVQLQSSSRGQPRTHALTTSFESPGLKLTCTSLTFDTWLWASEAKFERSPGFRLVFEKAGDASLIKRRTAVRSEVRGSATMRDSLAIRRVMCV